MRFKKITYKRAILFLLPRHYSGRKPHVTCSFGAFKGQKLLAVCTFGKPASNSLCIGVCGKEYSSSVYELNRLCREDGYESQLSEFVAWCLKQLKPLNLIIISYADTAMDHQGYIYQATNFFYTGATKKRTDKYTEGGKHSRHYDKDEQSGLRKVRSSKHRYIYFAGSKTFKKEMLKNLKYEICDYPKGDNKTYELGDYLQPEIISTKPIGTVKIKCF